MKIVAYFKKVKDSILFLFNHADTFTARQLRKMYLIGKGFIDDNCFLRASALAYTTLLSIVPLFAGLLLVVKAIGSGDEESVIVNKVEAFISKIIPADTFVKGGESVAHIIATNYYDFAQRMSASKVGGIGAIFLAFMIISLLRNIETSLNDIWGVKQNRYLLRRFLSYWAIITLTPILILVALSSQVAGQSQYLINWIASKVPFEWFGAIIQSLLLPIIVMTVAYTLFYMIGPNTKVKIKSAFWGGLVAAVLFNLLVLLFGTVMSMSGKLEDFRIVYGAIALIPILLIFVYIVWLIILFGAEVSFADQNAATYYTEQRIANISIRSKELLSLRILSEIAYAFVKDKKIPTAKDFQVKLELPIRAVNHLLEMLEEAGLLICIDHRNMLYHPAHAPTQMKVRDVLLTIREYGNELEIGSDDIGKNLKRFYLKVEKIELASMDISIDELIV